MFELELLPERVMFKFNRQLPFFNWYYPFEVDSDRSSDPLKPFLQLHRSCARRRAVYIHIPFCDTVCSFCPFSRGKFNSVSQVEYYFEALLRELEIKQRIIGRCKVDCVFIGGGTPSVLTPSQIELLGASIHRNFDTDSLKEFTFEIEVKSVTPDKLISMQRIGVNRISFGAQTFSTTHRTLFSLDASISQIQDTACLINEMFSYTNVDMIYGMAGQSVDQLYYDAEMAMQLQTTTIDFYPLNNLAAQVRMHRLVQQSDLQYLSATQRTQYRLLLDQHMRTHGYIPINGYSYSLVNSPQAQRIIQHSPKFLYHDIVNGYSDDEIIGYGSSALSRLSGYNLYNISDRLEYARAILEKYSLPCEAFKVSPCHEKGIVSFPYRGILDKARISWQVIPEETSLALNRLSECGLVMDRGDTYELSKLGWLFYVNLMYYLMPSAEKLWISNRIDELILAGHICEETELNDIL